MNLHPYIRRIIWSRKIELKHFWYCLTHGLLFVKDDEEDNWDYSDCLPDTEDLNQELYDRESNMY